MQYSREMLRTLSGSNTNKSLIQWVDTVIRDITRKVLRAATLDKATSYEYTFHKEVLSVSSSDYDGTGYKSPYSSRHYLQFFKNADAGIYVLELISAGLRKSFPDCSIDYSWISQSDKPLPMHTVDLYGTRQRVYMDGVREKYNIYLRHDELAEISGSRFAEPFMDVVRHKDSHPLPGCSRIMITVNWA
jgi:hypothetical protein